MNLSLIQQQIAALIAESIKHPVTLSHELSEYMYSRVARSIRVSNDFPSADPINVHIQKYIRSEQVGIPSLDNLLIEYIASAEGSHEADQLIIAIRMTAALTL